MSGLVLDRIDTGRTGIYRIGGAAALVGVGLTAAGVVAFVGWPHITTGSVTDWFARFRESWFVGLVGLDIVMFLNYLAMIPLTVALFAALRRTNLWVMALAAVLALVAFTSYFASSRMFEMLALSRQYAAAATEADRAMLLAAGQSMLTTYLGVSGGPAVLPGVALQGTAFAVGYVLWTVAGALMSAVMLRDARFGRLMGWLGIIGNIAALGLFVPAVGPLLSVLSLPLLSVWFVLIALRLLRLPS